MPATSEEAENPVNNTIVILSAYVDTAERLKIALARRRFLSARTENK